MNTVTVDDKGVIAVVATGFNDPSIDGKGITMVPYHDASAPKNPATAGHLGAAIFKWVCGPSAANGIPMSLLPNSCRGN